MNQTANPVGDSARRPLKSRATWWAQAAAAVLLKLGVKPNQVSLASIGFGALAASMFIGAGYTQSQSLKIICLLLAAADIQLRLLCNLLDGLLAVEGGLRSALGEIYNELPDRLSDGVILIGAGYFVFFTDYGHAFGRELGFLAAFLAVLTAYIRALGVTCGTPHFFCGPMAKPHRMAVLTGACVIEAILIWQGAKPFAVLAALVLVVIGAVYTCIRRLRLIGDVLEGNRSSDA